MSAYYVKLGPRTAGPMEAADAAALPGFSPHSLVCPASLDPRERRHWKLARSFPELREALARPRGGAETRKKIEAWSATVEVPDAPAPAPPPARGAGWFGAAAAAAAVALLLAGGSARPPVKSPAPPPTKKASARVLAGWEPALDVLLPSCGKPIGAVLGIPQATRVDQNRFELRFVHGSDELRYRYDTRARTFYGLTPASDRLLDQRFPCR